MNQEFKKITKAIFGLKYEVAETRKEIADMNIKINALCQSGERRFLDLKNLFCQ